MNKKTITIIAIILIAVVSTIIIISNTNSQDDFSSDSHKQSEQTNLNIQPTNIMFSVNSLDLKKGENYALYVTVSPSNASQEVVFSSTDSSVASVDSAGTINALNCGTAVIRAETINGLVAICNVNVTIATGVLKGTVSYSRQLYGDTAYPDSGAYVQIIPTDIKVFPSDYRIWVNDLTVWEEYGIYIAKVDSSGYYNFYDVPAGKYELIIVSENARWNAQRSLEISKDLPSAVIKLYGEYIGGFVNKSTETSSILTALMTRCYTCASIEIKEGKTLEISRTMTDWSAVI